MASISKELAQASVRESGPHPYMDTDVYKLLEADYERLAILFGEFERMASRGDLPAKKGLAARIFLELTIHMQVVEEVLHAGACEALGDSQADRRARAQHAFVRRLIDQLETMPMNDDYFDIKMMTLGDYALRDVLREDTAILPQMHKANVDFSGMGAALASRRSQLLSSVRW